MVSITKTIRRQTVAEHEDDVPVQQTQCKITPIPVRTKWHLRKRAKVIYPIQMWFFGSGVEASEKEVDGIWFARAQRFG